MELLFSDAHEDNTTNALEKHITIALQTTFEKLAPIHTIIITHKKKPMVMPAIFEAIKDRDQAFKRASLPYCSLDIDEHKRLCSLVSNSLDTVKSKCLKTRLKNANLSKERWRELRSLGIPTSENFN